MSSNQTQPAYLGRQTTQWGATAIATIALLGLSIYLRLENGFISLDASEFDELYFESELLGIAMEQMFIPLIGLFLLSLSRPFQRFVTPEKSESNDRRWVFGVLVALLLLELTVTVWLNEAFELGLTNGLVLVLISSLLGDRRTGLKVGLIAYLFYIVSGLSLEFPFADNWFFGELLFAVSTELSLIVMIWGAIMTDIWWTRPIDTLKPLQLFLIGFVIEYLSAFLFFGVFGDSTQFVDEFPGSIIVGLSLMLFGFLVQQANRRSVELRLKSAEQAQTQAELTALRAQINPHFLFNALSTIKYHARTEPTVAYDLLDDLSDLFRTALRSEPLVTLEEELHTVEAYLGIEKARLRERLTVEIAIEEAVDLTLQVPALVLQPLIENSIMHGIAPKPEGGTISIDVRQLDQICRVVIRDDGLGFDPLNPTPSGTGIGLANSTNRMISLYGEDQAPSIKSRPGKGTEITLHFPL